MYRKLTTFFCPPGCSVSQWLRAEDHAAEAGEERQECKWKLICFFYFSIFPFTSYYLVSACHKSFCRDHKSGWKSVSTKIFCVKIGQNLNELNWLICCFSHRASLNSSLRWMTWPALLTTSTTMSTACPSLWGRDRELSVVSDEKACLMIFVPWIVRNKMMMLVNCGLWNEKLVCHSKKVQKSTLYFTGW